MKVVDLLVVRFADLSGRSKTLITRMKLSARAQGNVEHVEIFAKTPPAISFRYVPTDTVTAASMALEATFFSSNGKSTKI